jgi:hypothetical protein
MSFIFATPGGFTIETMLHRIPPSACQASP